MTEWLPHVHQTPGHGPLPVQLLLRHRRPAVWTDEPWRPWAPGEERCSRSASLAGPTWRTGVLAVSKQQWNTKKGVSPRLWYRPHHLPWQHRSPSNQEWWEQLDYCLWVSISRLFFFVFMSVFFLSFCLTFLSLSLLFLVLFSFLLFFTFSFSHGWLLDSIRTVCMDRGLHICACVLMWQSLYLRCEMWVPSGGNQCITVERCRDIAFQFELCFEWLINRSATLWSHTFSITHIVHTQKHICLNYSPLLAESLSPIPQLDNYTYKS